MPDKTLSKENLKNNYNSPKALNELMIDTLAEVDLSSAKDRQEFLRFVAGFKSSAYSLNNSIMLYKQAQEKVLLPVFGSFNEWKEKHNVSVQRGSSAMVICMPHEYEFYSWQEKNVDGLATTKFARKSLLSKDKQQEYEKNVGAGTMTKGKRLEFFFNPCIFSLTQTTMPEADRIVYLQRYNAYNTSTENVALYKKLSFVAKELGLAIEEKPIDNEALGWIQLDTDKVTIKSDLPIDSKCAVATQEIGHYLLHRHNNTLPKEHRLSKAEKEIQAELFSHLIMENVGIDSERQFSLKYISSYLKGAAEDQRAPGSDIQDLKKDILYRHLETVLPAVKMLGGQLNQEFVSKQGIEKLKGFQPKNFRQEAVGNSRRSLVLE